MCGVVATSSSCTYSSADLSERELVVSGSKKAVGVGSSVSIPVVL